MSVLSEQERERILLEERYRSEVRAELDSDAVKSKKQSDSVVTFLNSALGIWLLSTVAVGLITWSYSVYHDHLGDMNRKASEARQIDLEIMHRLRVMKTALLNLRAGQPIGYNIAYYIDQTESSQKSFAPVLSVVFPQFEKVSTEALLLELSADVDRGEATKLSPAIAAWERMLQIRDEVFDKIDLAKLPRELGGEGLLGDAGDLRSIQITKLSAIRSLDELDSHFRLDRWRLADGTHVLDVSRSTYVPRAIPAQQGAHRDPTGIPPPSGHITTPVSPERIRRR